MKRRRVRRTKYSRRRKSKMRRGHGFGAAKLLAIVAAIGIPYWMYWWIKKHEESSFAGLGRARAARTKPAKCAGKRGQKWTADKPLKGLEHTDYDAFTRWAEPWAHSDYASFRFDDQGHLLLVNAWEQKTDLDVVEQRAIACGIMTRPGWLDEMKRQVCAGGFDDQTYAGTYAQQMELYGTSGAPSGSCPRTQGAAAPAAVGGHQVPPIPSAYGMYVKAATGPITSAAFSTI